MKLHRNLGVTQKTAWHRALRVWETWNDSTFPPIDGAVEVDETYEGLAPSIMHSPPKKDTAWRFLKPGGEGYEKGVKATRKPPKLSD